MCRQVAMIWECERVDVGVRWRMTGLGSCSEMHGGPGGSG